MGTDIPQINQEEIKSVPFVKDESIEWENVAPGMNRKIMSYDDRVMLVKVSFTEGAIGALHSHYHTQISYVDSGSFNVEIDGVHQILNKGDVFYVAPNLVHGVVCLKEGMLIDVFSPMREDFIKSSV